MSNLKIFAALSGAVMIGVWVVPVANVLIAFFYPIVSKLIVRAGELGEAIARVL